LYFYILTANNWEMKLKRIVFMVVPKIIKYLGVNITED